MRPFAAAPRVTRLAPAHGSVQSSRKISVRAAYQDPAGGTGVKASGVRLTVDGHDMTRKARITDSSLSVNLTGAALGAHKITLRVADRAGNVRSVTHTVTVGRSGGANEEPAGVAGEDGRAGGSDDVVRGEVDGRAHSDGESRPASRAPDDEGPPTARLPDAGTAADPVTPAEPETSSPAGVAAQESSGRQEPADHDASQTVKPDAHGQKNLLFLLGLALASAAGGFGLASSQHARIGAAAQRLRETAPFDRPHV